MQNGFDRVVTPENVSIPLKSNNVHTWLYIITNKWIFYVLVLLLVLLGNSKWCSPLCEILARCQTSHFVPIFRAKNWSLLFPRTGPQSYYSVLDFLSKKSFLDSCSKCLVWDYLVFIIWIKKEVRKQNEVSRHLSIKPLTTLPTVVFSTQQLT